MSSLIEQCMGDYLEEIANLQAAMRKQKQDSDHELEKQKLKLDEQKLNLEKMKDENERLKEEIKRLKGNGSNNTAN